MVIKNVSKSKMRSRSRSKSKSKSKKNSKVLRATTNGNGNVKYDYISKSKANKHMKPRHTRKDRYKKTKNLHNNKHNKYNKQNKNNQNNIQKGGYMSKISDCGSASVKEPGFSLAGSSSGKTEIPGLSIPETRAMLYTPNCSIDKYQAMVP